MKLTYSQFLGEMPQIDPMLLPPSNAVRAWNVRLQRGSLEPFQKPKYYRDSRRPKDQLALYRFAPVPGDPESGWILSWDSVVDCVPGPVAGNSQDLTYWTGDGVPKYGDNSILTAAEGPLPANSYDLGVPAPEYGPHAERLYLAPEETEATEEEETDPDPEEPPEYDESTVVSRDYVVTFIQQLGSLVMEGPPSDPSNVVDVPGGEGWGARLTNIPTIPVSGSHPWTGKRLYRRLYSSGVVQYGMVTDLGLDDSEFDDVIPDAEIPGDLLVSGYWDPPPEDLHSLIVLSNGIMAGARDNDVCISEPYLPHAWSPFSRYPVNHSIVGIGQADNNIVAVTARNPYLITGVNPGAMSVIELKVDQGCLAKRSIVSGSFGCCYAAPDGIMLVSQSGSRIITEGLLTRQQWLELNPASMISTVNEDLLIVTFTLDNDSQGTFLMAPGNPQAGIRFSDQIFTSAYQDGLLDSLLVYDPTQGGICLWDEGEELNYTWKSPLNVLPIPLCMTAARIEADSYENLVFNLYVNRQLKYSTTVLDSEPFRLPGGYQDRLVQVEIKGTDLVRKLCLAEVPNELE